MTDHDDPEISYEAARDELIGTVQKLESGGLGLAESLALWERGEHLAQVCQQWLDGARARLEQAGKDENQLSDDSSEESEVSSESDDNEET